MSKPKVWTLPELLDRIWMLSRGKRTAVAVAEKGVTIEIPRFLWGSDKIESPPGVTIKRIVTGWDEDYKPRTYELNKISAASAAALYERIKTMRPKPQKNPRWIDAWNDGYEHGLAAGRATWPQQLARQFKEREDAQNAAAIAMAHAGVI